MFVPFLDSCFLTSVPGYITLLSKLMLIKDDGEPAIVAVSHKCATRASCHE